MRAFLLILAAVVTACSTSTYSVRDGTDPTHKKVLQSVRASSPGGDTFVVVVYNGANKTPIVSAGGDASRLVAATAAAGRKAVTAALKVVK